MSRRLRVAFASPLPPARSGVADYSRELLPHLARHVDVTAFTDTQAAELPGFAVERLRDLPAALAAGRADVAFYQLGNCAPFHGEIYRLALAHPGVVLLHEYALHHLVRDLTLARGDVEGFVAAMRQAHGEAGERAARRSLDDGVPVDPWTHPLFEPVVDASLAVIAHNEATRERVLASRPAAEVTVVPQLHDPAAVPAGAAEPGAARAALGLPADAFLVGVFGFVTPAKRLEVTLAAFARLRAALPAARLLIVGEVSPAVAVDALLAGGRGEGVELRGRVPLDDLQRHMAAVDVAVNLRWPTGGETSATLVRLLGLGKAVVVSNAGASAEIPDGCCAKVDVDWSEEETLFATLRLLARDPELRRAMGEQGRRHVAAAHAPERASAALAAVLERAARRRGTRASERITAR